MKKWKIIKRITIGVLVLFGIWMIADIVSCINMTYPHPMLGVDAYNWFDQFIVDMAFSLIIMGLPLLIDIILLIASIIKTRKKR